MCCIHSYCALCLQQNQEGAGSTRDQPAETATGSEEQTESAFEQLFSAVAIAADGDRVLCQPFKVLPCRTVSCPLYDIVMSSSHHVVRVCIGNWKDLSISFCVWK